MPSQPICALLIDGAQNHYSNKEFWHYLIKSGWLTTSKIKFIIAATYAVPNEILSSPFTLEGSLMNSD